MLLNFLKGDKMFNQEVKDTFSTNNSRWDSQIAFSPKDVAIMLNIPLSTITKMCRDRELEAFKIGRHYRIKRKDIFKYIEKKIDESIII